MNGDAPLPKMPDPPGMSIRRRRRTVYRNQRGAAARALHSWRLMLLRKPRVLGTVTLKRRWYVWRWGVFSSSLPPSRFFAGDDRQHMPSHRRIAARHHGSYITGVEERLRDLKPRSPPHAQVRRRLLWAFSLLHSRAPPACLSLLLGMGRAHLPHAARKLLPVACHAQGSHSEPVTPGQEEDTSAYLTASRA